MNREEFANCAIALRNYWDWENEMHDKGIYFESSPINGLADTMLELLTQGERDWGFDPKIGINWIVVWCSAPTDQTGFQRANQWITIANAVDLYDFVEEMIKLDWQDQIEDWRWL